MNSENSRKITSEMTRLEMVGYGKNGRISKHSIPQWEREWKICFFLKNQRCYRCYRVLPTSGNKKTHINQRCYRVTNVTEKKQPSLKIKSLLQNMLFAQ